MIVASMATVPYRAQNLPQVIGAILPQVDQLNVYLNGYSAIPTFFFSEPKIRFARSQNHGDRGASGKFFWADSVQGYHLTIDDDIIYPPDYVEKMIEALGEFDNKAAVCVHGTYFKDDCASWSRDRGGYHFIHGLNEHRPVNAAGTGTLAYHTDFIRVSVDDIRNPNMCDLWFAVLAKQRGYRTYCIQRHHNWLQRLPEDRGRAIYDRDLKDDSYQTQIVKEHWPWPDCKPESDELIAKREAISKPRIGMVLRDDTGGLANISGDFYRRLKPDKYIIVKYGQGAFNCNRYDERRASCIIEGDLGNIVHKMDREKMEAFLFGLDAVLCFETPYNWQLFNIAREMGVKSYLMIMYEWTQDPMPVLPDHILVPQDWYRDEIGRMGAPAHFVPLPVDRRDFQFRQRERAQTFLCNAGRWKKTDGPERDGLDLILKALPMVKSGDAKFIIRASQPIPEVTDPRVTVDCEPKKNAAENYQAGDVFLLPRRFQAMSMPVREAMSCGMPVLTTGIAPHASGLPEEWFIPYQNERPLHLNRTVKQVDIKPEDIAAKIDEWAGKNISAASQRAGEFAEALSWQNLEPEYRKVMELPWKVRRIAAFGDFNKSWTTETHYAKTFKALGYDVVQIDSTERDPKAILEMAKGADIFWGTPVGILSGANPHGKALLEMLKEAGMLSVGFHLDLYFGISVRENRVNKDHSFWSMNYVMTADCGHDDEFAKRGINHFGLHPAVYHEECYRGMPREEYNADIVFVGTCKYPHKEWPYRARLIEWLRETYADRFVTWGPGSDNHKIGIIRDGELNNLYASAKIVIGDSFYSPNYWSDRLFEVPGRGGFPIFPFVPGIEKQFDIGKNLVVYDYDRGRLEDFGGLKKRIDHYLEHSDEREAIRQAGHAHVKANHTYINRALQVIQTLESHENERRSV